MYVRQLDDKVNIRQGHVLTQRKVSQSFSEQNVMALGIPHFVVLLDVLMNFIILRHGSLAGPVATNNLDQENFAYAKLFALTDDGRIYRLMRRDTNDATFAFKEPSNGNKFEREFAFAKRANFAKRSLTDLEWEEVEGPRTTYEARPH